MAEGARRNAAPPYSDADFMAAQDPTWQGLSRSRERDECRQRLQQFGILES
jgi:thymidylate synthase (FAD)